MASDTSTGPERVISSIGTGTGTSFDAALDLGRRLAEHLDDHDLLGYWMAHHLAALIEAADGDATVEKRATIVELILKVWSHHEVMPSPPLEEFTEVLAALERLGNDQRWAFSRQDVVDTLPRDGEATPLVALAVQLEHLARRTIVRLLWLEASQASTRSEEWLTLADQLAPQLESSVTARLRRLALEGDEPGWRDDLGDDPVSPQPDPLSNAAHAERLRSMAQRLTEIADELSPLDT